MSEKSIKELTEIIIDFGSKRGWSNQIPNELITSIFIELGELAEHYQWKNKFEELSEEKKEEIGFEFVDVLFYLFALAHHSGIDIEKYFDKKVPLLAKKFPIGQSEDEYMKNKKEYRKTGKNKLYK